MHGSNTYENYPIGFVLISNLTTLSIYALGALIFSSFGILIAVIYILCCFGLEIRLLRKSCVNCYYYGKLCFSGKGLLCSIFFKKGDPQKFTCTEIRWIDLLPDFIVSLVPLLGGIILSIIDFSWLRVGLMILLVIFVFPVTGYIRGTLACKYCKQREIGCPAVKLFSKK